MNWKYFFGASFLVLMLLLKFGIPVPAIVAGIAMAALFNWIKQRNVSPRRAAKNYSRRN